MQESALNFLYLHFALKFTKTSVYFVLFLFFIFYFFANVLYSYLLNIATVTHAFEYEIC